ncbi:MAG: hypothetical protein L3J81_05225 [Thermoplasmata archaeon]|nr:hypothetical protein [Thermoplasmata archaeon]MCI4370713.1 hypothetical protein [Thermoplasmata archaeon]
MEYVVLATVRPTWLNLQLPTEVSTLLTHNPDLARGSTHRTVAFLGRGPGVVRVVSGVPAASVLPVEIVRGRYLAPALATEKGVFSLPLPVIQYLGLRTHPRPPRNARSTDDTLLWFLPAPEYYEFRAQEWAGQVWTGPTTGGLAHVYLARAVLPMTVELAELARSEAVIEGEEWRPRAEALVRGGRARRH